LLLLFDAESSQSFQLPYQRGANGFLIRRLARWEILQRRGASRKLRWAGNGPGPGPLAIRAKLFWLPTSEAQVIECMKGLRSGGMGLDRIAVPWMPKASSTAAMAALRPLEEPPPAPREREGGGREPMGGKRRMRQPDFQIFYKFLQVRFSPRLLHFVNATVYDALHERAATDQSLRNGDVVDQIQPDCRAQSFVEVFNLG
jgi:hypothetical protein